VLADPHLTAISARRSLRSTRPPFAVKELHPEQAHWFTQEVAPHDSGLRAYLHAQFPAMTRTDVEDIVQDSYVKVLQARDRTNFASVKAYLFATARNAALFILRRPRIFSDQPVTDIAVQSISEGGTGVAEQVSRDEEIALLLDAIEALPARCREVFILRKLRGMPQKQIATRLGISEQTVQVQITRAAKKCAQFLRQRGINGRRA
jgi:RNA polymerase sigma-70 factor (ECF subfamily)